MSIVKKCGGERLLKYILVTLATFSPPPIFLCSEHALEYYLFILVLLNSLMVKPTYDKFIPSMWLDLDISLDLFNHESCLEFGHLYIASLSLMDFVSSSRVF